VIQHRNVTRTQFYKVKDRKLSQTANALYRLAKIHFTTLNLAPIQDLRFREGLYQLASDTVEKATRSPDRKAELLIELPMLEQVNFFFSHVKQFVRFEIDLKSSRASELVVNQPRSGA
jgi:tagatose-1,6-bisphosphate aldolase non-catalytic subunit AgaZ/GatZ